MATKSEPKFELVAGEPLYVLGASTHRIRALRRIPTHGVEIGDLGGYVQTEGNLSHSGDAWISGNAMALQRSLVEDDALATDDALLAGFAILRENGKMTCASRADGHAIIKDHAQITDMASAHDTVTISGDTYVDQGYALTGASQYRGSNDAPSALRLLDPAHSSFGPLMNEAINIDPTLHRVFAALGVPAADQRPVAIAALQRTPEGRSALTALVRAVGGTFYPDAYLIEDGRAVAAQMAADVVRLSYTCTLTNLRHIIRIGPTPYHDTQTGDPLYPAVLKAVRTKATDPLYQAAILRDHTPEAAITTLPMTIQILPDAYASQLDAEAAAMARLTDEFGETATDRPSAYKTRLIEADLSDLPVLVEATQTDKTTRLVLSRGNGRESSSFMQLGAEQDFGSEFDIKALSAEPLSQWHSRRLVAAMNPVALKLTLPPPSRRLLKAIHRATISTPPEGQIIMKRDMDLIRSILLEIESNKQINGHFVLSDSDIMGGLDSDRTTVQYHLRLLMDAGYIEGKDLVADMKQNGTGDVLNIMRESGTPITISRMTWAGHEFTDTVRDNKVWSKTKGYLKDLGGVGIDVLKDVAKAVVKDQITQVTGLTLS